MNEFTNVDGSGFFATEERIRALGGIGRSLSDRRRRFESREKRRMLNGEFLPLIYAFIDTVFSPEVAVELKKIADPSVNLLTRIADETSLLYRSPPLRNLSRNKGGYQSALSVIMPGGLDAVMRSAQRRLIALGKVALKPVFLPGSGKIEIHHHSPDNLVVLPDYRRPSRPLAVAYSVSDIDEKGREVERWVYFDESFCRVLDEQFEDISESVSWYDRERPENPYGAIPFVFLSLGEDEDDFWQSLSATDGLYRASLLVALNKTDKQHKMKWASFKQIAVKGELKGETADLYRDPAVIFQLDGDAGVEVMDTQSDFAGYDAAISSNISDASCAFGLSLEDFRITLGAQSGFSRLIQREKLIDRNNLQKPMFQKAENELYRLIARMVEVHKPSGVPLLDESDTLNVEFTAPPPAQDFSTLLSAFEKQLKLGLLSPVDIFRMLNPGVTEEEADTAIRRNLKKTEELYKAVSD
ncbi:MAG: hypothetical protein Kow0090_21040 [Myxococcota bacterium]